MQTAAQTRRFVRLKQRHARSQLKLARLRKRERARDAHEKFRLGALAELLDWDQIEFVDTERLVNEVRDRAADPKRLIDARIAGANWFERHKNNESLSALIGTHTSPEEQRARAHRLITIGGLFVHPALDALDRATLLGLMLEVDRQTSLSPLVDQGASLQ